MAPQDLRNERPIKDSTFTVLFLLCYEAPSSRQIFHFLQKVLTCPPNLKVEEMFVGGKLGTFSGPSKEKKVIWSNPCQKSLLSFPNLKPKTVS